MTDLTATMHGKLLATLGQQGEFGDQLLRELVGAIHIVATRDDAGQLVGCHVRLHHHLCIPGTALCVLYIPDALHQTTEQGQINQRHFIIYASCAGLES